jgi:hypothetical protein
MTTLSSAQGRETARAVQMPGLSRKQELREPATRQRAVLNSGAST